ncbi:MAG TPA: glycosyltransferase family A protein [Candidatus Paceibacterota bacterium]
MLSIIVIGNNSELLKISLDSIKNQTFKDYEIIISDQSSKDINRAIKKSRGKLIKFLLQGDYFYRPDSLEEIINNFDLNKDHWLVTACEHTKNGINLFWPQYPRYNDEIHITQNTIGTLSSLTIKNENPLFLDKKLTSLADGDYYKRYFKRFGNPKIMNKINVVNRTGNGQISKEAAGKEYRHILKKYNKRELLKKYDNRVIEKLELKNVTLVSISSIEAMEITAENINFREIILTKQDDFAKYLNTDFALIIHHDGYVLRPYKWDNAFLEYDFIGNDTFSLRSKKFIKKDKNIKVATDNIQKKFSGEKDSFGFSKNKNLIPRFFVIKKRLKRFLGK